MKNYNTICSTLIAKMTEERHDRILRIIHGDKTRVGLIETLSKTNVNINDYFIKTTYTDKTNEKRPCYDCTKLGCYLIRDKMKGRKKNLLSVALQKLYEDESIILVPIDRKEVEFLNQLEDALEPFGIKGTRQYPVLSYRIDYYIESLNIAIEYDENNHMGYSYEAHEGRQAQIEEVLGCRFIRISDDKTNAYNIGYVLKMILEP